MNEYGPCPRWQERLATAKTIDMVERLVIGTILLAPYFLDLCEGLRPDDFKAPVRGRLFAALQGLPAEEIDPVRLALEMERSGERLPAGSSWHVVVSTMLDDACLEEGRFRHFVGAVIEDAELRHAAALVEA